MTDVIIQNIGYLVTGDIDRPFAESNRMLIRDGVIAAIGDRTNLDTSRVERVINAGGAVVIPGLIDSHVHPVIGDFTPRQRTLDFIESYLHGGVTSMISAGEPHAPGRPKDPAGTKALAVLAAKSFANARPAGVKVLAGALLLEPGLNEEDFREVAAAGVRLVGEIGISGVHTVEEALPMVTWARQHGMKVLVHMGGASIPGSEAIDAEFVVQLQPDVASHVNGGPTAPAMADVERVILESAAAIEVVQCGNVRALRDIFELIDRHNGRRRVIIGTDSPSGTGVIPLGMLRTISWIASLAGVEPEVAIAMATGNTARLFELNRGRLAVGLEADVVIIDAPRGSQAETALEAFSIGDTPSVAAALIDGEVVVYQSRNTPPSKRHVSVPWLARDAH